MKKPTTPRMMSTIPRMRISTSGYAPPAKQVDNEYDDGDDEQDMQKSAHRGAADQAHEPQNQQNDDDGPDHGLSSLFLLLNSNTKRKADGCVNICTEPLRRRTEGIVTGVTRAHVRVPL